MSKAGFILYGAKGKIGNIVAQKSKAGSILREKVDPTNAKTRGQIAQRALFSDAVSFYKSATKNLLRFAFEDKKTQESDFNAFMRHNAKNGIQITKAMKSNSQTPFFGNWILSVGSLANVEEVTFTDSNHAARLNLPAITEETTTVGALSTILKAKYNLIEGDIVTVGFINTSARGLSASNDESVPGYVFLDETTRPTWTVKQFIIKEDSTVLLSTFGWEAGEGYLTIGAQTEIASAYPLCGAFVIFSRKTADGLLVSNSSIVNSYDPADDIYQEAQVADYQEAVFNAYGGKDAILQGSLA